jgi:hypothetical protein
VTNAATVAGLNTALANVGAMRSLAAGLTTQNRLDIAAYVNSAK